METESQHHHLLQSLLPSSSSDYQISTPVYSFKQDDNKSSNAGIIYRLSLILFISIISIWANHESSKGFSITIINEAEHTLAGKRFNLFYRSNDKATRIILSTSKFVESILYNTSSSSSSEINGKKKVNHVTLCFSHHHLNLTETESVYVKAEKDKFTIHLNPSLLMHRPNHKVHNHNYYDNLVYSAIQRGMAQIWLWNGKGKTPKVVINAMVESISRLAEEYSDKINEWLVATDCFSGGYRSRSSVELARFYSLYERQKPGFLRRLNERMHLFWNDGTVDDALGMSTQILCQSYNS